MMWQLRMPTHSYDVDWLYRMIKKYLCTWFGIFEQSPHNWRFEDGHERIHSECGLCYTEHGLWEHSLACQQMSGEWRRDTLNITCNFLYCNHQVHTDFLIILYIGLLRWQDQLVCIWIEVVSWTWMGFEEVEKSVTFCFFTLLFLCEIWALMWWPFEVWSHWSCWLIYHFS